MTTPPSRPRSMISAASARIFSIGPLTNVSVLHIPPVKTNFGYHLILVEDKKPAGYRSLEEVRESILSHFSRERREQLASEFETFVDSLKDKYKVEMAVDSLETEDAGAKR